MCHVPPVSRAQGEQVLASSRLVTSIWRRAVQPRRPPLRLEVGGLPWQFDERQARPAYDDLIRTDSRRSFEPSAGTERNIVVLVDTIPAHPDAPHQLSILVQRHAARKDLGTILQAGDVRITTF